MHALCCSQPSEAKAKEDLFTSVSVEKTGELDLDKSLASLRAELLLSVEAKLAVAREELRADLSSELQAELQNWLRSAKLDDTKQEQPDTGTVQGSGQIEHSAAKSVTSGSDDPDLAEARLEGSIWDAALLVGVPQVGVGASWLVVFALFMNIAIQVIFIGIVYDNLLEWQFSESDLRGLEAWRYEVGHDSRFVGKSGSSKHSLVDRVCQDDPTLEMATEQKDTLNIINSYLPRDGDVSFSSLLRGPMMCLLALSVWIMCILREIRSVWNLFCALRFLPTSAEGTQVVPARHGFVLCSLSRIRGLGATVISFLRLTLAGILLGVGAVYLCYTISVSELMLNALALELIINMDELIYQVMAPLTMRKLIARLAPLQLRLWPRWHGMDISAMSTPLVLLFFLVLFWSTTLQPSINNLQQARDMLCGDNRSFSFRHDGLEVLRITGLPPFEKRDGGKSLTVLACQKAAKNQPIASWDLALASPSATSSAGFMDQEDLKRMQATVLNMYVARGHVCHDALDHAPDTTVEGEVQNQWLTWRNYLARALGLEHVGSCRDVAQYCRYNSELGHLTMALLRALCPVTCGCNSLLWGSVFIAEEFGCPAVCLNSNDFSERHDIPCADTDTNNESDFRTGLARAGTRELAVNRESYREYEEGLDRFGCSYFISNYGSKTNRLCIPEDGSRIGRFDEGDPYKFQVIKLMTLICPESCNCGGRFSKTLDVPPARYCPQQCDICHWDMPVEVKAGPPSNCSVPHVDINNTGSTNVSVDGQCCYLLKDRSKWARELRTLRNPHLPWNQSMETAFNESNQTARTAILRIARHLCNIDCRTQCLAKYLEIQQNESFHDICWVMWPAL